MARKRSKARPGRETPKRQTPREKRQQQSRKAFASLVEDRTEYLRANLTRSQTFSGKSAAQDFIVSAATQFGARYELQSRKNPSDRRRKEYRAVLREVDSERVAKSSTFKQLLSDLRSRSNSAKGRKARALEQLGRRENFYTFAVGES